MIEAGQIYKRNNGKFKYKIIRVRYSQNHPLDFDLDTVYYSVHSTENIEKKIEKNVLMFRYKFENHIAKGIIRLDCINELKRKHK